MQRRALGRTGLDVTPLCLGGAPLGGWPEQYGHPVDLEQAVATVLATAASPITFVDTSNDYFDSEVRIGEALRRLGGLPAGWLVATKVDPVRGTDDFSGARVRASVQESRERLGLDHLPLVQLHEPGRISFEQATAPGGAVEALLELQADGVIEHLGVAAGSIGLSLRYLRLGHFATVLTHNRWTLLDQSAGPLLQEAAERGVAVLNGAPYGGGILATGTAAATTYGYVPLSAQVLQRAQRIEQVCQRHDVPLAAVALQFSLRTPGVTSTVVGMSAPSRVQQTLELASRPVPDAVWDELTPLTTGQRALPD